MNRLYRLMMIMLCFELGALLFFLPWTAYWEKNYFLVHFPSLIKFLLHPSVRGIVSGLGVLDILAAFAMIRPQPDPSRAQPR